MTVQIGVADREPRSVTVTRSGNTALVRVDDVPVRTATELRDGAVVLEIDARSETVFTIVDKDLVFVHAFGRSWTLVVGDPAEKTMAAADGSSDVAVAPMPGVLVSLFIAPADQVTEGQALAVIESMKMQTEIKAPRAGVVDRVLVPIGGTFDGGAPLISLVAAAGGVDEGEES